MQSQIPHKLGNPKRVTIALVGVAVFFIACWAIGYQFEICFFPRSGALVVAGSLFLSLRGISEIRRAYKADSFALLSPSEQLSHSFSEGRVTHDWKVSLEEYVSAGKQKKEMVAEKHGNDVDFLLISVASAALGTLVWGFGDLFCGVSQ